MADLKATIVPAVPAQSDPLLPEWQRLIADWPNGTFTHDPTWLSIVEEDLSKDPALRCVVRDRGELVAIFPLTTAEKSKGLMSAVALGMPHHPPVDLSDAIIAPTHRTPEVLDCAFDTISDSLQCDVLTYNRVRSRSCFLAAIEGASFHHYLADAGSSAFCDVRDHSGIDSLSKSQVRNVERLRRRAEKDAGDVTIESATGDAIEAAFERFLVVEAAGWKGEGGTALAMDERKQSFYRKLLVRLAAVGRARINLLHIGGQLAAGHLSVRAGRTWFLLKIGYDQSFRDYGPGTILLLEFLEEMSSTADVDEVNLTTNPPWADRWHFQIEPVQNVVIYGRTLRGRALSAERAAKEMIKAVRDRLPARDATPDT